MRANQGSGEKIRGGRERGRERGRQGEEGEREREREREREKGTPVRFVFKRLFRPLLIRP